MAMEQRHRQLLLQRADLPGDRRLRQPKLLAGMRKAPCLRRSVKHLQLVPIHVAKSVAGSCHDYSAADCSLARAGKKVTALKGTNTPRPRRRAGLPIGFISDIAGGEHAWDRRGGRI